MEETTGVARGPGAGGRLVGRAVIAAAVVVALLAIVGLASNADPVYVPVERENNVVSSAVVQGELTRPSDQDDPPDAAPPRATENKVQVPPAAVIAVVAAGTIALLYMAWQHRPRVRLAPPTIRSQDRSGADDEPDDEEVVKLASDLIADLSLGPDPRIAIQRAYAAVETGFGSVALARKAAETPLKYLKRVFGRNPDAADSLETLTGLFEIARFSDRPVDEAMRTEAIEALSEIRDKYQNRKLLPVR